MIGQDYPYPIVDHTTISKVNIGRMKAAYEANAAGGAAAATAAAGAAAGVSAAAAVGGAGWGQGRGAGGKRAVAGAGSGAAAGAGVGRGGAKKQRSITDMLTAAAPLQQEQQSGELQ